MGRKADKAAKVAKTAKADQADQTDQTDMKTTQIEHRRHPRFPLGLPVKLTVAGRATPLTVELMDLSKVGGRFRAVADDVHIGDNARFGFVIPGQRHCMASGRCVRVRAAGEFALTLERSNDAFRGFMDSLSGKAPAP